jgi:hypothetical protein
LTVTNEEGIINEPGEMQIAVSPVSTSPTNEDPLTIKNLIKDPIKNPLDLTNS